MHFVRNYKSALFYCEIRGNTNLGLAGLAESIIVSQSRTQRTL